MTRARQLIERVLQGTNPRRALQEVSPQDFKCLDALMGYLGDQVSVAPTYEIMFDMSKSTGMVLQHQHRSVFATSRRLSQDLPGMGLWGLAAWMRRYGFRETPLAVTGMTRVLH